jgi:hypothetical protein
MRSSQKVEIHARSEDVSVPVPEKAWICPFREKTMRSEKLNNHSATASILQPQFQKRSKSSDQHAVKPEP